MMSSLTKLAVSTRTRASALPKPIRRTPQNGLLWSTLSLPEGGGSSIKLDQHGFRVKLDVQDLKPEEVKAKIVDDYLVVEGKRAVESDESCFVCRQFTSCFMIPDRVDIDDFKSTLSADGVLMLHAPNRSTKSAVRHIPINQVDKKVGPNKEMTVEVQPKGQASD